MANAARERSRPADHQIEPLTGPHSPGTAPSQTPPRRVVAVLAAHNRREMTLACLRSYFTQEAPGIELRAVVVDDRSFDGTGDAVSTAFPAAEVISSSGDLFWARGMVTAEASAMRSDPDYLLWLNDDVRLYPDALRRLLRAAEVFPRHPVLLAGSVCDPETGVTTYGGQRRRDWHPLRYALVTPLRRADHRGHRERQRSAGAARDLPAAGTHRRGFRALSGRLGLRPAAAPGWRRERADPRARRYVHG